MITINSNLTKNFLNKDNDFDTLMLTLQGEKQTTTKERMPLNISFVLDTSMSMNANLNGKMTARNILVSNNENGDSKLDKSKIMIEQFIRQTNENDYVSIVTFNDEAQVVAPSQRMSEDNKKQVLETLKSIQSNGMTALHDGWLKGAQELSNNISKDSFNRVILLSDGQANRGVTDTLSIKEDTKKMQQAFISTSTFGVGADFNEDLLQSMAYASGGNSYYLKDPEHFSEMARSEIKGINNIVAFDVKMKIDFSNSFKVNKQYHDFDVNENEEIILPDVSSLRDLPLVFNLSYKSNKKSSKMKCCDITLTFKDEKGRQQSICKKIEFPLLDDEKWKEHEYNHEVLVKKSLMEIAERKDAAKEKMDEGKFEEAENIFKRLQKDDIFTGIKDSRIDKEKEIIGEFINNNIVSQQNYAMLRKDLSFQSYNSKTGL